MGNFCFSAEGREVTPDSPSGLASTVRNREPNCITWVTPAKTVDRDSKRRRIHLSKTLLSGRTTD